MADTKLNIIITAVDKTKGAFKGVGGALGSIGKFAGTAAIAGIGAAAAGVGALAVGVGKLAKEAATLQPIEDAFTAINESIGGNADEMIRSLSKSAGGLVTNTDLMKQFNTAAQLVNKDFAVKLPDAMEYLGKVAGATGQDMDFMMSSLVTGIGRLSPMILDNLGIQVDVTAANEAFALSLGKTASELTKTEQQTALMNQVMEKLETNTEGMESIQDPFKQLSVTMLNLKDTVAKAIGPVILPLIQKLADAISTFVQSDEFQQWLADAVVWLEEKLVPALMDIWAWLAEKIPPVIRAMAQFWRETLAPALKVVWGWITEKLIPALKAMYHWFNDNIVPVIKAVVQKVKDFAAALRGLSLPDWLTPGSPTPLELGLRGINDAMSQLNKGGLPKLSSSITMNQAGGAQMAALPAGGGGSVIVQFNSPVMGFSDEYALGDKLVEVINRAQRRGR